MHHRLSEKCSVLLKFFFAKFGEGPSGWSPQTEGGRRPAASFYANMKSRSRGRRDWEQKSAIPTVGDLLLLFFCVCEFCAGAADGGRDRRTTTMTGGGIHRL